MRATNSNRKVADGTTNMSIAATPAVSLRRKTRQVGDEEPGFRPMYLATVAWLTSMPIFSNSPWMRGAPHSGVAPAHLPDQITNLPIDRRASGPGAPAPIEPKPLPVPPDHGRRLHQHQQIQAPWPHPIEPDPYQAVYGEQPNTTGVLTPQDGQLVAKRDNLKFQGCAASAAAHEP